MDREVLDPARVMEGAQGGMGQSRGMESGIDNSLDFLKNAVDLGVSSPTLSRVCMRPSRSLLRHEYPKRLANLRDCKGSFHRRLPLVAPAQPPRRTSHP